MIELWAPDAGQVELDAVADGVALREPLTRAAGGWWRWEGGPDPATCAVFDYGFVLDGGPTLPDPRSAWQPDGVHGRSRWWTGDPLTRRDPHWRGPRDGQGCLGGVLYELHVGTFTDAGTLDAAVERLDHLVDLGVDVVELMPVAAFPGQRGWGYDGVGFYSVHDAYGGPDALLRFVDACHARGLGVCLDVVHNHLGPEGSYLGQFGPYFTDTHDTPWGWAVNLDATGNATVRQFIIDAATRWFEVFGVDALRLDAVHELKDDSAQHLLAELAQSTAELGARLARPLDLIAESDLNDAVMVTPVAQGGLGMTAQWADDVHHALHVALTGETQGYYADFAAPDALAKTLTGAFFHTGGWSSFRGRSWGAPLERERVSGHRFVAYLQTHDQVGNRAVGDRIGASLTPGQEAVGAALFLLSPFTPMIFMGQEWGAGTPWQFFTDFEDTDLGAAVSKGRRAEFAGHGWVGQEIPDPQDVSTRDASRLRWEELESEPHHTMLQWYRRLIALRRAEPDLHSGDLTAAAVERDHEAGWLVLRRGAFCVVANLAAEPVAVDVGRSVTEMSAVFGEVDQDPGASHTLRLGGHSVAVVRCG